MVRFVVKNWPVDAVSQRSFNNGSVLDGPAHAYFAHHAFGFRRDEVKPLPVKIPISNFTDLSTEVSYLRHGVERRYVC